jgi:hypothetical protein
MSFPGLKARELRSHGVKAKRITNGDLIYVIETSSSLAPNSWTPAVTHGPGNTSSTISHTLPTGLEKIFSSLKITGNNGSSRGTWQRKSGWSILLQSVAGASRSGRSGFSMLLLVPHPAQRGFSC